MRHDLDDLAIGFLHTLVAESRDIADRVFDTLTDKSVATVELAILRVHLLSHNARVDSHGNLRRARRRCTVAYDSA